MYTAVHMKYANIFKFEASKSEFTVFFLSTKANIQVIPKYNCHSLIIHNICPFWVVTGMTLETKLPSPNMIVRLLFCMLSLIISLEIFLSIISYWINHVWICHTKGSSADADVLKQPRNHQVFHHQELCLILWHLELETLELERYIFKLETQHNSSKLDGNSLHWQ